MPGLSLSSRDGIAGAASESTGAETSHADMAAAHAAAAWPSPRGPADARAGIASIDPKRPHAAGMMASLHLIHFALANARRAS